MVLEFLFPSILKGQSVSHYYDKSMKQEVVEFHVPNGVDLMEDNEYASQAALWGIEVETISPLLMINFVHHF